MSSKYWIKLYHEILDDPKMGMMPEILFGRCMKLFLIAGDFERDGELPPVEHIAWRLRRSPEEIESDLIELQRLGIAMNKEGVWSVKNWKKRQGPMPEAERSRRRRADQHRQEYAEHGPAHMGASTPSRPDTDRNRDRLTVAELDTDIDIDTEEDSTTTTPIDTNSGAFKAAVHLAEALGKDNPKNWAFKGLKDGWIWEYAEMKGFKPRTYEEDF